MKKCKLSEAECGHVEVEADGTEVFVCDVLHVWTRKGGGNWVPARSPSRAIRRDPRLGESWAVTP